MDTYVAVVDGDLPLILTCPHGGYLKPGSIPDRKKTPDTIVINDRYTIDTTHAIANAMAALHDESKRPYIVTCNVARIKVDVNRRIEDGTDSKEGRVVWKTYHESLNTLTQSVLDRYGYALMLDIHGNWDHFQDRNVQEGGQIHSGTETQTARVVVGHGADHGLVELGYLLRRDELESIRDPNAMNAAVLTRSSIRHLANRMAVLEPHELLRGPGSMGDLIENAHGQIRAVPSPSHPYPKESERYFQGGYTTRAYAARAGLDVIQVELPRHLRFTLQGRKITAAAVARAATCLLKRHYHSFRAPVQAKL